MEHTIRIELTPSQRQAFLKGGDGAIRLVDPETQKEYVIIQVERYQRLERLLYDDSEAATERGYSLSDEVFREDWDNPKMAEYDRYEEFKK